jgi:Flp pilus assembly protein TadD
MVRDPDDIQALNFVGYTWAEQKRNRRESLKILRRAHRISPLDPYLMDSLAVAMANASRLERAATLLWRAHRLMPFDPDVLTHLGRIQEKRDKRASAHRLYRRAISVRPLPRLRQEIESRLSALGEEAR